MQKFEVPVWVEVEADTPNEAWEKVVSTLNEMNLGHRFYFLVEEPVPVQEEN